MKTTGAISDTLAFGRPAIFRSLARLDELGCVEIGGMESVSHHRCVRSNGCHCQPKFRMFTFGVHLSALWDTAVARIEWPTLVQRATWHGSSGALPGKDEVSPFLVPVIPAGLNQDSRLHTSRTVLELPKDESLCPS